MSRSAKTAAIAEKKYNKKMIEIVVSDKYMTARV